MSRIKILVVEDEEVIALDLEKRLKKLGYEVIAVFPSSREAIVQLEFNLPNLIIMDVILKDSINGINIGDIIRQTFNLPIIYLTTYNDPRILEKNQKYQSFSYLLKPIEEREMVATIEIAISRHEAEKKIKQAYLKEQEINQLKSHFIAAASHEFRTPLTTISSSVDLLKIYSQNTMDDLKNKHFSRIHSLINDMTELLDILLSLSQIEANQLFIKSEPLKVVSFCQNLIVDLEERKQKKLNIILTSSKPFIIVKLKKRLLHLILGNLLDNAINYSTPGQAINLQIEERDQQILFSIRNRGIGIITEEKNKVFEYFYRGSNVGNIKGRGLGLAIVKNCVKLHDGQITIDSEVGIGTTVMISIPLNYSVIY